MTVIVFHLNKFKEEFFPQPGDCRLTYTDDFRRLRQAHTKALRNNYGERHQHLCALLGKIGLSFQKAKFVSDKVGEEEYERNRSEWKKVTWPPILKAAREKNAVIMFGDEAPDT